MILLRTKIKVIILKNDYFLFLLQSTNYETLKKH